MDVWEAKAMLRLAILGLIVICGMLVLTNPSHQTHKDTVYESAASEATKSEMLGRIAADLLGGVDVIPLNYNNYFLFSTTTLNGETASVGVLSRVWKIDRSATAAKNRETSAQ
jgi:hypothetical protein